MEIKSLDTKENREILSELLDVEIVDIQLWRKRNGKGYEVLYFWPHFWWFRKRSRMDLEVFNKLMKED